MDISSSSSENQRTTLFQKLFQEADQFSHNYQYDNPIFPIGKLKFEDTSVFDERNNNNRDIDDDDDYDGILKRKSIMKLSEPDIDTFHSIMKQIKHNQINYKSGKYFSNNQSMQVSIIKGIFPEMNWEKEVYQMMHNSDNDNDTISNELEQTVKVNFDILQPQQRIDFDLAPFYCFETDFIDIDQSKDPLDILILNGDKPSIYQDMIHSNSIDNSELQQSITTNNTQSDEYSQELTACNGNNIVSNQLEKEQQRKIDKVLRDKGYDITGFAIENNNMNESLKDTIPQYRNRSSRSFIAALNHSNIASAHRNVKPDLSELDLRLFHRPRMLKDRDRNWQISLQNYNLSTTSSSQKKLSSTTNNNNNSFSKVLSLKEIDKQNLSLIGNNVNFILLEYIEEIPPILLNYGMASAMLNYYRTISSENDEDDEEDKNNENNVMNTIMKKKKTISKKKNIDNILGSSSCCRLPRHLLLLLQLRNVKQAYDHDVSIPRLSQGETKVLGLEDESPFLAKIEEGEIIQSFTNNLFKAPIFKHKMHSTDFLIVRIKTQSKLLNFHIREIPQIYLCGQLEPQRVVPRPVSKITQIQERMYLLAAARYLYAHPEGVEYSEIQRAILRYCLKEHTSPHKSQHRSKLKDIIRKVGEEIKQSSSGIKWYPKDWKDKYDDIEEAKELEKKYSPEEIEKTFSPEDVCLQEACNAAEYRLFQQQITDIDISKIEIWLNHMSNVKRYKIDRIAKAKMIANEALHKNNIKLSQSIEKMVQVLMKEIQRLDARLSIARFLFEKLAIAPWNTTSAYVHSHIEKDGQGKMQLRGIADPSGIGEGYSFLRILRQLRPIGSGSLQKKKMKFSESDKDLRKLTKKDAVKLLIAIGIRESVAMALKRWDCIHIIEGMSTKLEKTGLAKELHKYARGDRGSGGGAGVSIDQFQETVQDIWNRQKAALSNTNVINRSSSELMKHHANHKEDADGEDSSEDDFAEDIEKSLAARASANAFIEEQQVARYQQQKNRIAEERKEFSSMTSFLDKLDTTSTIANNNNTSSSKAIVVASSSFDLNNTSLLGGGVKKRKVQVGIIDNNSLPNQSYPLQISTQSSTTTMTTVTTIEQQQQLEQQLQNEKIASINEWIRPSKAVKRTIKIIRSDGTESIRVEFIFNSLEIERVERNCIRMKKERESKRTATSAYNSNNNVFMEDDDEKDGLPTTTNGSNSMKINLSKIKKAVDNLNNAKIKKARLEEEKELLEITSSTSNNIPKQIIKSSKRSLNINARVPKISFAVRLEKEIMELWRSKNASFFWYPVNFLDAPGYYSRIEKPISLNEIREKIVTYQYETAIQFIEDITLMAKNAEIYNGPNHLISIAAKKLLEKLIVSLNHEREHLGPESDSIHHTEEAIKRKKIYLQKNIFSTISTSKSK